MQIKGGKLTFEVEVEEEEKKCCICLSEERDLPVTSCCGKMVHERCVTTSIKNYRHCPHCREDMPMVKFVCLFFAVQIVKIKILLDCFLFCRYTLYRTVESTTD